MKTEGFRPDINGLRAWAVVAVVLYHFGVAPFGGGFIGVDVFFVISGFLMAGIVERGISAGNFSFSRFYMARAARIWPALIFLCLVVMGMGWFLLVDAEYSRLGKHVRDSLLFSSNMRYADEAGYFDTASHGKWLLHTWSLSVEWQFYLIFPVIYWLVRRFMGVRALPWVIAGGIGASLFVSEWMLSNDQETLAFFSLQSRAWEMLAGSLVFMLAQRSQLSPETARIAHYLGFLLIALAIFQADAFGRWPGMSALLPVVGAALIILSGWSGPLVSGRIWQWLGDKSYSIYLWHWPVMVLLNFYEKAGDFSWVGSGILLSLVLGGLSHRLIEQPARFRFNALKPAVALPALFVIVGLTAGLAQYVRKNSFSDRLPEAAQAYARQAMDYDPGMMDCLRSEEPCIYGGPDIRLVVIGDSHAGALASALASTLSGNEGMLLHAHSACLINFGATRPNGKGKECTRLHEWIREDLANQYPGIPVVLINRTTVYAFGGVEGESGEEPGRPMFHFGKVSLRPDDEYQRIFRSRYIETLCHVAQSNPLYVVQPVPEMGFNVPEALSRDAILGRERELFMPLEHYQKRHASIRSWQAEAAERCGIQLLDPVPYLCKEGRCEAVKDRRALYYDDDHMSEFGSRLLVPMFRQIVLPGRQAITAE